jgi:NAD+ kinase
LYNNSKFIIISFMKIKRAGIISNRVKDLELKGAILVAQYLRKHGIPVGFDEAGMPEGENEAIDYSKVDCLFVLGGDGTLLKAAHKASLAGVCMLGINFGRLGFLPEVEINDIEKAVDNIIRGDFHLDKRLMLECRVIRNNEEILMLEALNDIAVLKKDIARTINIKLIINGVTADRFNCDGVLVSTPTGSTGYSLSAGGPILDPGLDCLLATPVCPHTLHSRAMVVPAGDEIIVVPQSENGMALTSDGSVCGDLRDGDTVRITKSKHHACFIRFHEDNFYPLLKSKFNDWTDGR